MKVFPLAVTKCWSIPKLQI